MTTQRRDSFRLVMDEFNRQPLIPQEALPVYFARARTLIMEAVMVLLAESDHIQTSIANIAVDKVAKLDHHRVLFKRSATLPLRKGTSQKVRKNFEMRRLLEQTMDIADGYTAKDVPFQTSVVLDLALTRSEFEGMLCSTDDVARQYIKAHDSIIRKRKMRPRQNTDKEREVMKDIEEMWNISRYAAYGVFRMVLKRLEGVRAIYSKVFNAYARLLVGVANATSNREHILDTVQDGAPGLWYAISSYDHNSPSALAAYARWWIRQQALHHMKIAFNMIKPSLGLWQQGLSYEKVRQSHETKYGSLGHDEVPTAASLTPQQLEVVMRHKQVLQVTSLDATVNVDGSDKDVSSITVNSSLGDQEQQEDLRDSAEKQQVVKDLLQNFDPMTRRLVCFHFGLWEYLEEQNLPKVEVLRERIRQITASTLQGNTAKTRSIRN